LFAVPVLAARLALATVFAVAGAAKLRDRAGTRQAVDDFGAPERLASPLALALPLAELTVAGLLLPDATAEAGEIGALALLLLFCTTIAVSLARGRTPDCHCFGQLYSAPVSWRTLLRNGILAAVAVFALTGSLAEPDRSAVAWIARLDAAEILALAVSAVALVLLAVGTAAFMSLLRSYGGVLVRLERVEAALEEAGIELGADLAVPELGLEPGSAAPPFEVSSVRGEAVTLEALLARGRPLLLLFTSPRCGPCKSLLPTAAEWQREYADELTVVFASDGSPEEIRAEAEEFELSHVLVDQKRRLYRAYEAGGTPGAVLIAQDGTIASWLASGSDWIERLVAQALQGPAEEQGLPPGAEAPSLELASLDGETVALETLRGRDTLLLFWNPGCGFCRAMHEELLAWEQSTNGEAPRLVIVSSGDAESTRSEGFGSLVLVDEGYEAGAAFGAGGTPMAVLVGSDGRVASEVVAGAEAVFALANGQAWMTPHLARGG
jgi:methylamine dehydrogenase accessory protein MauD